VSESPIYGSFRSSSGIALPNIWLVIELFNNSEKNTLAELKLTESSSQNLVEKVLQA